MTNPERLDVEALKKRIVELKEAVDSGRYDLMKEIYTLHRALRKVKNGFAEAMDEMGISYSYGLAMYRMWRVIRFCKLGKKAYAKIGWSKLNLASAFLLDRADSDEANSYALKLEGMTMKEVEQHLELWSGGVLSLLKSQTVCVAVTERDYTRFEHVVKKYMVKQGLDLKKDRDKVLMLMIDLLVKQYSDLKLDK